jgi:dTMP kinase
VFITFEGVDGSGKSTQIALLKDRLAEEGVDVLLTREPGGTRVGEKIRALILDPENAEMDAMTEMFLYAAARAQLAREVIRPAIDAGKTVICDRWVDSSIVYQGVARGLGRTVKEVNFHATAGLVPDRTILLDLDPEVALQRAAKRGADTEKNIGNRQSTPVFDRMEAEGTTWHRKVREAYRALAAKHPGRIAVVDASGSMKAIQEAILKKVGRVL